MRVNRFAGALDSYRGNTRGMNRSTLAAEEIIRRVDARYRHSGSDVADVYGLLVHYTTLERLSSIVDTDRIGINHGCWLTPTPYAACMTPYDLGLNSPRNVCLLVDVSNLPELWGPWSIWALECTSWHLDRRRS